MIQHAPLLILAAAMPIVLMSCARTPTQSPETTTPPEPADLRAETAETGTARQPDSIASMSEAVDRMDFWLKITGPPMDHSEGQAVFSAHGHPISRRDYEKGLAAFLAGREPTAELEQEYRQRLENQLLVLRWIEESGVLRDSGFRIDARQAMRGALEELVLNRELDGIRVTDEDVRNLYEERMDEFRTGEKVAARIILLPTEELAERVMDELRQGASFRDLAAAHSIHESRSRNGELEPFARGTYIRAFEDKAFELGVGETGMATTNTGTFIINKLAEIPAQTIPFEEVRGKLRSELEERRRAERVDQFLNDLRAEYLRVGPSPYGIGSSGR